ncbi:hypothetical protein Dimus_018648 [Dionaea muscipula]
MDNSCLFSLFSKFGVVKDAFIPRKTSKEGKRFGFVRYDCSVAAEVTIQKTNGLSIKEKVLKVKAANYARDNYQKGGGRRPIARNMDRQDGMRFLIKDQKIVGKGNSAERTHVRPLVNKHPKEVQQHRSGWQLRYGKGRGSYAEVVKRGRSQSVDLPTVKGIGIGNGWLYRSVVATFGDSRPSNWMLEDFMQQEGGDTFIRRMGNKQHWGEVLQIEEDTAKVTRLDVEKVKIFTFNPLAINHQMNLVVGSLSFVIRVAEEQVVFICNSDFHCQCACHVGENHKESSRTSSMGDESIDASDDRKREANQAIILHSAHDQEGTLPDQVVDESLRSLERGYKEIDQEQLLSKDITDKEFNARSHMGRCNSPATGINGPQSENGERSRIEEDSNRQVFDPLITASPAEHASPSGSSMPDTVVWAIADGRGLADISTALGSPGVHHFGPPGV